MSERLDIRLSEKEKKRLTELAEQKGISMTDLVRVWITRGDVLHVLAEQLQDLTNDFAKWHVLENRNTAIHHLVQNLHGRTGAMDNETARKILFEWTSFFSHSFQFMSERVWTLKERVAKFVRQKEPKTKEELVALIFEFVSIIKHYHNIFARGFIDILQKMNEDTKRDFGQRYNDEFRTRFNEIASKFEDFLKRAQRELGMGLEETIPRAKEFRTKE